MIRTHSIIPLHRLKGAPLEAPSCFLRRSIFIVQQNFLFQNANYALKFSVCLASDSNSHLNGLVLTLAPLQ